MPKIIDIKNTIQDLLAKNIMLPHAAEGLKEMEDEEFFNYIIESSYMIWGADTVGGLAYFGKKKDMESILKQSSTYLSQLSSRQLENQFYLYWNIDDYAMLLLYEDYSAEENNPYPNQNNVLCVNFGAWIDDDPLWSILNEKQYSNDIMHWNVAGESFDENNIQHKLLLDKMKSFILTIDNEQEDNE